VPYGISEYGVDASIALHSDNPHVKDYSEEYQALFHETVYPIIEKKEYLWGSFVWNMFDFHSSRRNEGRERHINAKGLVTYDRGCRKDAFYYYKAKWSSQPVLHLCSKRFANRHTQTINIKVYTNLQEVQLMLNGKSIAYEKNNGNATVLFKNVKLCEGRNHVIAKVGYLEDEMEFIKVTEPDESYTLPESNVGGTVRNWFLEDDMVREGYYSISNRADEILSSREARKVLERYVPELVKEMTLKDEIPLGLALKSILQRSLPNENKSAILKAINGELNQIRDEEL
jgi:beta-galactosidase